MREVAVNPLHGVYTSREAVGREGHFVTSPEISQMFGESLAIWFLNEWMKMGEPARFQLVELGPGKGTLMADMLATLARLQPGIVRGISVHLVEVSPRMKKQQEVDRTCFSNRGIFCGTDKFRQTWIYTVIHCLWN